MIIVLLACPLLFCISQLDPKNVVSIADHYGSVSIAIYAVTAPFFDLFNCVRALFLFEIGVVSARRLRPIESAGSFFVACGG